MSIALNEFETWPEDILAARIPANNNVRRLEVFANPVLSATTAAQPATPAARDVYILPASPTGAQWGGAAEGDVAIFYQDTWTFFAPYEGLRKFVEDEGEDWQYISGAWAAAPGGGGGSGASIGVQYLADTGSTADSDPGPGLLKWNNATQGSATVLFLDDETADGVSLTGWWAALDSGGFCYLQHATDQDTWQIWEIGTITDATGYVKLAVTLLADGGSFADGDPMLVTLQQGITSGSAAWGSITGTLASQTDLQAALDAKAAVGIPQNSQSGAYTLVLTDANKHIYHPSADTTARIWTIPANSSVAFPIGTAVTFVNDSSAGVITIAITTDTLVFAGTGTTGSRTLAANGVATAIKVTSTRWQINGTGLT